MQAETGQDKSVWGFALRESGSVHAFTLSRLSGTVRLQPTQSPSVLWYTGSICLPETPHTPLIRNTPNIIRTNLGAALYEVGGGGSFNVQGSDSGVRFGHGMPVSGLNSRRKALVLSRAFRDIRAFPCFDTGSMRH